MRKRVTVVLDKTKYQEQQEIISEAVSQGKEICLLGYPGDPKPVTMYKKDGTFHIVDECA